ncbi:MAG: hypothetical protein J6K41_06495 [Paraprevotella sp.]|nr:hypothetical protein [Paraprevotella sp.]
MKNIKKQYMAPWSTVVELLETELLAGSINEDFDTDINEGTGNEFNSVDTDISWKSNLWDEE